MESTTLKKWIGRRGKMEEGTSYRKHRIQVKETNVVDFRNGQVRREIWSSIRSGKNENRGRSLKTSLFPCSLCKQYTSPRTSHTRKLFLARGSRTSSRIFCVLSRAHVMFRTLLDPAPTSATLIACFISLTGRTPVPFRKDSCLVA